MSTVLRMRSLFVLLVLCLCTSYAVSAQTETATLSGVIQDPKGATVPDAEVTVTRIETGTSVVTKTNGAGIYFFTGLQPGHYHLMVRKPGFKEIAIKEFELYVQDKLEQNFSLEIGSVSETVTVEAGGLIINTTDASVSTVVDRQFAENLPMNGRSFQSLIELTPGVVITPSNNDDNGQFSVNGQRAASNYWTIDGVSANIGISANYGAGNGLAGAAGAFSALGGTNSLVSVDALQEFRIQTSTFAPEFGRTPGGQISIATRSGTNQFHGTAFDYLRNDTLDANNWFNGYVHNPPLPKARERQNDFGGTIGGPVFKNRTFFFFSYEGLRLQLPETSLTTVPDIAARASALPAMRPFLNAYPIPNGPDDPTTAQAQFSASYSVPASLDAYSLRIDHRFTDNLTLFGRYNYSPSSLTQRGQTYSLNTVSAISINTQTLTLGTTWSISQAAVNDFRFNYSRTNTTNKNALDNFGGAVPPSDLPFPSGYTSENAVFQMNIFSLEDGVLSQGRVGRSIQRQFNLVDSVSVQRGSHSVKFGVDFRRLSPIYRPLGYEQGVYFGDVPSAQAGSLLFANLISASSSTFLFRNLGLYGQDSWRITPRVTLTYGLRWDVDFVPQSLNGPNLVAVTGFDPNNLANVGVAPAGTPPYPTKYGNVAPRVGIAYRVRESPEFQTVLRGGFGIFYDLASSEVGNNLGFGYPFANSSLAFGGTFPLSSAAAEPPAILPPNPTNPPQFNFVDPHLKVPYTLEWNVALDQSLGNQQALSVTYIGARGRNLLQTGSAIAPNADISFAYYVASTGTSDYDALQVQFQRRLVHGLQALAGYTLSHSIDTGSAGSVQIASNIYLPASTGNANRGPSDFDIRNSFSAGLTYDMPSPHLNAFADFLLRGWSTDNFILARSAPPVNISDQNVPNGFASGFLGNVRPDVVAGQSLYLYGSQYPGGKAINPGAFKDPPLDPSTGIPLRQGTTPRNFLRGFGAVQWDFSVHRDFLLRESVKLQFRAEMFNVLNHPNFGSPNGQFGQGGFGLSTELLAQYLNGGSTGNNLGGGAFSPLYQIGGPRSIQLALKFIF